MTEPKPDRPEANRLDIFAANNPEARCETENGRTKICRPWADESLELIVRDENYALVSALNSVHLPPRFTAIWHLDSKDLEVIAGPMSTRDELRSRSFAFLFDDRKLHCGFGDASDKLLLLARCAEFDEDKWSSDYRNLRFLHGHLRLVEQMGDNEENPWRDMTPTSFWIRGLEEWDEDYAVRLAQHLNFYMHYFDRETPQIVIHENLPEQEKKEGPVRYPFGEVPSEIPTRPLDPFLLGLWESSLHGNPRLRFLYNYQILEYAAFYYVKDEVRRAVRRTLASPHTSLNLDQAIARILDAMSEDRQQDEVKMKAVVQEAVDPLVLWTEMEPNIDFFSNSIQFDGGLRVEPMVKSGWNADDFVAAWHPKFTEQVRKIRNALVHGREQRMANVITPTRANDDKLRPWLPPCP